MFRNYFLINLLLVIIIAVLGIRLYKVLAYRMDIPEESSVEKVEKSKDVVEDKRSDIKEAYFEVITENDLFRPSRSAPTTSDAKSTTVESKNPPKLFGTIILEGNKTAILEDPETKTSKIYRINDSLAGYVVSEILEEKVVLLRNGEEIEVKLRDDKGIKPVKRTTRRQRAVRTPRTRRPVRRTRPVPPRRNVRRQPAQLPDQTQEEPADLMEQMEQMDQLEQMEEPEE